MAVYTYDPSKVFLFIAGYRLTGIVSIGVNFQNPTFTVVKGLRGSRARVLDKSTEVTITITANQQSMANSLLSMILEKDIQYGTGRLEISLVDNGGETLIESDNAFVEGYPNFEFGEEAGTRTWTIRCMTTRNVRIGSNFKPALDLF